MSDLFGNTSTPQWESPAKFSLDSERASASIGQAFGSAFNAAASRKQQQGQFDQQVAMKDKAQERADFEREQMGYKMMGIANELKGATTPEAAWAKVSENPQWLVDPTTAPLVGKYLSTQAQVATAQKQTIAGQIAIKDSGDFLKRLNTIQPEDRAAIQSMNKNKDGSFSAMQWQTLGMAEQTMKTARQNDNAAATNEAMARGDQQTTTINDKGVSTTFKPAPADKTVNMGEPMEKTFDDGTKVIFNPRGVQFSVVKDGKEKPMSNAELLTLFKVPDLDPQMKTNLLSVIQQRIPKNQQPKEVQASAAPSYKSANEVKSAFTSGKISKEDAQNILQSQFGYE